jgi:hypothetical protein
VINVLHQDYRAGKKQGWDALRMCSAVNMGLSLKLGFFFVPQQLLPTWRFWKDPINFQTLKKAYE